MEKKLIKTEEVDPVSIQRETAGRYIQSLVFAIQDVRASEAHAHTHYGAAFFSVEAGAFIKPGLLSQSSSSTKSSLSLSLTGFCGAETVNPVPRKTRGEWIK